MSCFVSRWVLRLWTIRVNPFCGGSRCGIKLLLQILNLLPKSAFISGELSLILCSIYKKCGESWIFTLKPVTTRRLH